MLLTPPQKKKKNNANSLYDHVLCVRFRCLKYWLKGERKGRTETFIDNLPNGPDNINLAPDGSFWIALIKVFKHSNCEN